MKKAPYEMEESPVNRAAVLNGINARLDEIANELELLGHKPLADHIDSITCTIEAEVDMMLKKSEPQVWKP